MQTAGRDHLGPVAAAGLLVVVAGVWGSQLDRHTLQLDAPPFVGQWDLRLGSAVAIPLLVGTLAWWSAPWVQRRRWPALLGMSWLTAAAWALALALVDGPGGLTRPLLLRDDYLHDVPRVHSDFLSSFTAHIEHDGGGVERWTTHVGGHPPGLLLLLKALDVLGLGGAGPAAALFVAVGTSAVVAVLLTVRRLAGEPAARSCAAFVALAPAAIWVAVSADAFFMGVTAWGIALLALKRPVAAGTVLGLSLFLTYGAVPLSLLALAVAGSWRAVAKAAIAAATVAAAFALAGFWWVDGLVHTLARVHAGAGGYRPWGYFLLADVAVLAVAVGPATVAGLRSLTRADPLWWLVAPVLLALLLADVSGTSRGEVERVWLPYVPWLLVAAARLRQPRRWLAAQLTTGLALQVLLRSKW